MSENENTKNSNNLGLDDIFKALKAPPSSARKKIITEAYEFSKKAHEGQKRLSGEDYFQHTIATAITLAQIGMGGKAIAAGLLHDVPEDTNKKLAEIEQKFGEEVAFLVNGVTKLGKLRLKGSQEEYFIENLRKMFLAMAEDIRVVIVKLADRLHNMRTLQYKSRDKQIKIARETMEIFAPIANRLGIGELKSELQDLSFKYLEPENYQKINELLTRGYEDRSQYVDQAMEIIKEELKKEGINVIDIHGRAKSLYSASLKLQKYDMDISKIYDLSAIRIIVPEIADCYETLGIVHKKFKPMIGRIKDYISLPKPNGYQSIHSTIFGPEGRILEIQIRTQQMHNEAEFGIAAHWIYADKVKTKGWKKYIFGSKKEKEIEKELRWVRQLREWQREIGNDNSEFIKGLKIEFFKNHIFAFTPKGDIIELPEESTPVDFAYAIHSEVGSKITGAKADGKMVPLDYNIKNGEVIEIITSKDRSHPNLDWLKFVKTSTAKNAIRKTNKKDTP